ncbi:MAG: hypothetical protein ABI901_15375, partial [Roseiflexaceae bacterium]
LARPEAEEYQRVGCKFAGRCPQVMDICTRVEPKNIQVEEQMVKCHLYDHELLSSAGQHNTGRIPLQPAG